MALTDFGSLTENQKRYWSLKISKQGRDDNFFMSNGFMGNSTDDSSKPIQKITELTKVGGGTKVVLPLVGDITGGVVGDNLLEGSEQPILSDVQIIQIDQMRNGCRSKGRMSEQETVIRFRVQARDVLAFWLADLIDDLLFQTVAGRAYTLNNDGSTRTASQIPSLTFAADVTAASTNRVMFGGVATAENNLTTADTLTWDTVTQAKSFAKRKRIRPIRAGGKSYYILVLSTEQCRDLEKTSDYKAIQAQAMPRGLDNPLFNNAKKVINEVVIYDHQKVYNTLGTATKWGAGTTVNGAQAFLMGAQALGYAALDDGTPGMDESDNTDYGNRPALGIHRIIGMLKPQYKSKYDANAREDYGVISIKTAAAAN